MIAAVKHLLTVCIFTASLSIIGCNGASLNDVADSAFDNGDKTCHRSDQPFKHTLCEVSQDQLTAKDPQQVLKLFWRTNDVITADKTLDKDSDKVTQSPPSEAKASGNTDSSTKDTSPLLYKFDSLLKALPNHTSLKFAANAGMYNNDFAPIGYTVIQGREIRELNLNEGGGNFHLLPNGVLWWNKEGEVFITESHALAEMLEAGTAKPWYATQSGPMLVIKGDIHPKFDPNSSSLKFRNGVGVCTDGEIKFINSDEPVSFYQFASLFKDELKCPNALFLDGGVASALYAPDVDQNDDKNMGVMVGMVENN